MMIGWGREGGSVNFASLITEERTNVSSQEFVVAMSTSSRRQENALSFDFSLSETQMEMWRTEMMDAIEHGEDNVNGARFESEGTPDPDAAAAWSETKKHFAMVLKARKLLKDQVRASINILSSWSL